MTFHVHRSSAYYKNLVINSDEIEVYGFEKAIILSNIDRAFHIYESEKIHLMFPFIKEKKFYKIINDLLKEGKLVKVEGGSNE